ncbi:creatininase family protein [uncultured Alsobacter sp.]|uniref:creatininase family protein n=1 Tax=uncultured Alsobacter sp. TaxID=1748258 RepID=UPI0025D177EC|nr:creatininase family protein [uncultured Alsobacter sp.]
MKLKSHWWWDLSSRDFTTLDMEKVVAVLPVGAVEQHGPHLPVKVDAAANAGIVERAVGLMPDDLPVLVLPMMPVGKSNEHNAYPGTLSLSHETLFRLWYDIGESVARTGCRKLIVFNAHGGQPQVIDILCRELRVRHRLFAVNAMWFGITKLDDLFSHEELVHGIHAGEVETSVMLHLHGDLVDMSQAADFRPLSMTIEKEGGLLSPEGRVGFGWQAQDLEPSGASGNAAAADAERGAVIVDRAARALVQLCTEVAAYPLSRVTQRTIYSDG